MLRLLPGPGNWITQEDLWDLRCGYYLPIEIPSVREVDISAKVRLYFAESFLQSGNRQSDILEARWWKGGCPHSLPVGAVVYSGHHRECVRCQARVGAEDRYRGITLPPEGAGGVGQEGQGAGPEAQPPEDTWGRHQKASCTSGAEASQETDQVEPPHPPESGRKQSAARHEEG